MDVLQESQINIYKTHLNIHSVIFCLNYVLQSLSLDWARNIGGSSLLHINSYASISYTILDSAYFYLYPCPLSYMVVLMILLYILYNANTI